MIQVLRFPLDTDIPVEAEAFNILNAIGDNVGRKNFLLSAVLAYGRSPVYTGVSGVESALEGVRREADRVIMALGHSALSSLKGDILTDIKGLLESLPVAAPAPTSGPAPVEVAAPVSQDSKVLSKLRDLRGSFAI